MAFRSCRSAKAGWKPPWKWLVWLPARPARWSTGGCSFLPMSPGCLAVENKKEEKALPKGSCSSGLAKIRCENSPRLREWSSWGCQRGGCPRCPCTQGPCLQDPCWGSPATQASRRAPTSRRKTPEVSSFSTKHRGGRPSPVCHAPPELFLRPQAPAGHPASLSCSKIHPSH